MDVYIAIYEYCKCIFATYGFLCTFEDDQPSFIFPGPCPSPSARIRIVAAIFPVYLSTMLNKYTEYLRDTLPGSECPNSRPVFRSDEKRSDPLNLQYGTVHITRIYHHYKPHYCQYPQCLLSLFQYLLSLTTVFTITTPPPQIYNTHFLK
jgi:hypothetical protein